MLADFETRIGRAGQFLRHLDECDRLARVRLAETAASDMPADAPERGWYAVALVDIVGLRYINRKYGVDAGDEVLRATATRLTTRTRDAVVARVGADEFAVLVRHIGRHDGGQLCRALRREVLDQPVDHDGEVIEVTYHLTARVGPMIGDCAMDADWPQSANMLWRVQRSAVEDAQRGLKERLHRLEEVFADLTGTTFDESLGLRHRVRFLEGIAYRDPLTNLQNRRWMRDRLETLTDGYTLAFIDLDNLRVLNGADDKSWDNGDRALTGLARFLADEFGDDNVGRWGGDEYIVIVPGTTSPSTVSQRLRAVLARCQDRLIVAGHGVSFSGGVASSSENNDVLHLAHQRTKGAKKNKGTIIDADE